MHSGRYTRGSIDNLRVEAAGDVTDIGDALDEPRLEPLDLCRKAKEAALEQRLAIALAAELMLSLLAALLL